MEKQKISTERARRLKGFVDHSYVNKILKDLPQYKVQKQSLNRLGRNIPTKTITEAIVATIEGAGEQQHLECETCVEAYEIEKIRAGVYTYTYLQEVCCWLHETLELNCRGK